MKELEKDYFVIFQQTQAMQAQDVEGGERWFFTHSDKAWEGQCNDRVKIDCGTIVRTAGENYMRIVADFFLLRRGFGRTLHCVLKSS